MKLHNIGAFLAIVAGLFLIGLVHRPVMSPQLYQGFYVGIWGITAALTGITFIAASFIADRGRTTLARIMLLACAAIFVLSSIVFGAMLDGGLAAALIGLAPAVLGLIAAVLIGPVERSREEVAGISQPVRRWPNVRN